MLILRLILAGVAALFLTFGVNPAVEYQNPGAIFMLVLAGVFIVLSFVIRPIISMVQRTLIGKILTFVVLLAVAYFVSIEALIIIKEQPVVPLPRADAVIVLGAGLTYGTDQPTLALAYRLDQTVAYLKEYPGTPVIVSGGQGEIEVTSEARAMREYLIYAGVPAEQIIMEERSHTTVQNLAFSREIMTERGLETAAIVTSDYHCFRAGMLAEQAGISATCVPAKNVWWLAPADHFREFMAVTKALLGL